MPASSCRFNTNAGDASGLETRLQVLRSHRQETDGTMNTAQLSALYGHGVSRAEIHGGWPYDGGTRVRKRGMVHRIASCRNPAFKQPATERSERGYFIRSHSRGTPQRDSSLKAAQSSRKLFVMSRGESATDNSPSNCYYCARGAKGATLPHPPTGWSIIYTVGLVSAMFHIRRLGLPRQYGNAVYFPI